MRAVVERIWEETHDVKRFRLRPAEQFSWRPGQFVIIQPPGEEKAMARPYSIGSSPTEQGWFDLIIKLNPQGRLTPRLFALEEQAPLEVRGPFGTFYYRDGDVDPVVLIGGGSGIAPLRAILHYLLAKRMHVPITLFFGNRTEQDIILHHELLDLAERHEQLRYVPVVGHPTDGHWHGYAGHITESLIAHGVDDLRAQDYYLCGPPTMVTNLIEELERHAVAHEHIHHERW